MSNKRICGTSYYPDGADDPYVCSEEPGHTGWHDDEQRGYRWDPADRIEAVEPCDDAHTLDGARHVCTQPAGHDGEHRNVLAMISWGDFRTTKLAQVGGSHYSDMPIKPFAIIDAFELDFYTANALKYLLRHGKKAGADPEEDLRKAIHYIEERIARLPR